MNDPKNPPANAPTPRVHREAEQPPSGGAARGPADDQVPPEDLQNPLVTDYLLGALPDNVVEDDDQFKAAPTGAAPAPKVETKDAVVDRVTARLNTALKTKPDDAPAAIGEALSLWLLQNQIDPEAVAVDRPFNTKQVRPGGYAMLSGVQKGVEDAKSMKVDAPKLGQKLAQAERIRRMRGQITPVDQILDANESIVQSDVAEIVDTALDRGWSVIQHNGVLMRILKPALDIRGQPVADGLSAKAENQRREDAARADEQQKLQGQPGAAGSSAPGTQVPQVIGTLTTQAPPPAAVAGPPSVEPARGHAKKPAK